MHEPIICPYCSSIENDGRICFWCGNPVIEYESEEKNMTIEMKFTGLSPEQAMKLIRTATEAVPEAQNMATTVPVAVAPEPTAQSIPAVPAVPVQPVVPTAPAPTVPTCAPHTPAPVPAAPAPVPTSAKQYTADELAVAARPICELPGGREKLLDLLHSFTYTDKSGVTKQVQSIMDMPPELYPALANGIRQLGGRI